MVAVDYSDIKEAVDENDDNENSPHSKHGEYVQHCWIFLHVKIISGDKKSIFLAGVSSGLFR